MCSIPCMMISLCEKLQFGQKVGAKAVSACQNGLQLQLLRRTSRHLKLLSMAIKEALIGIDNVFDPKDAPR